jgi:hypothetical protein
MSAAVEISADGSRLTVRVPMKIRKRGGRKVVMAPQGALINTPRQVDSTLVKAIARAYRWQHMLEQGTYASAEDIALAEKISASYVNRLLQITLLSPALVEIVLEGRQPATMTTRDLFQPLPELWDAQQQMLLG